MDRADDRALVERSRVLDDRHAYAALVRKYQVEIRAYLLRLTRQHEAADDLAQDTFLHGYRRLAQLRDAAKFRSWLYAIASTQFHQWLRARKSTEELDEQTPAREVTVSARLDVETLLKTLRPDERAALVLCLAHDFSHADAASILSLPLGTVKSLVQRARTKLQTSSGDVP